MPLYGQEHVDRYVATDGRWPPRAERRGEPRGREPGEGRQDAGSGAYATPEEKQKLWPIMTSERPDYDRYRESTEREIPLVILEPA